MELPPSSVITIVGACLGVLLAGNAYFVKRLVDKIDRTDDAVRRIEVKMGYIEGKLSKSKIVRTET